MNTIKNIKNRIVCKAIMTREAAMEKAHELKDRAMDTTGEAYVDTAVKIIIAVVIGGLLMAGLVYLFNNVIMPSTESKVTDLFNGNGGSTYVHN